MNLLALIAALLRALAAYYVTKPLALLRDAELQVQSIEDDLRAAADSADVDYADRLRLRLEGARRYYAALQSAVSGLESRTDNPHANG